MLDVNKTLTYAQTGKNIKVDLIGQGQNKNYTFSTNQGEQVKVILSWLKHPGGSIIVPQNVTVSNLNFNIKLPNGTTYKSAASMIQNNEFVVFNAPVNGTYTMTVSAPTVPFTFPQTFALASSHEITSKSPITITHDYGGSATIGGGNDIQRRVIKLDGVWFDFTYGGNNDGQSTSYLYSTDDGVTWSDPIPIVSGRFGPYQTWWPVAVTNIGGTNHVTIFYNIQVSTLTGPVDFYAKHGVVNGTKITWDNPYFLFESLGTSGCTGCGSFTADTSTDGTVYAMVAWGPQASANMHYQIFKSTNGGSTWSTSLPDTDSGYPKPPESMVKSITELSSGKMLLALAHYNSNVIKYRVYDGTTWGTVQNVTSEGWTSNTRKQISMDSDSTHSAYLAYLTGGLSGSLKVAAWNNAGVFQSFETADSTLSHALPSITITNDDVKHIYTISGAKVYETSKYGTSWLAPSNPFGTTFSSNLDAIMAAISVDAATWVEISTQYHTKFAKPLPAPSPPTGLIASTISATQINLSWTAPTSDGGSPIIGYKIERKIDTGSYSVLVPNTGNTLTTYSDMGLSFGTNYTYRVSALNAITTGPPSNEATATTWIVSTDPRWESSGEQRVTYFDGTRNWMFYYDGANILYRSSSDNGVTWSASASTGSGSLASNSYLGAYGEGNTVLVSGSSTTGAFTKKGTISGSTISWSSPVTVFGVSGTNAGQQYYSSFEKVGSKLFLGFNVITKGKNVGNVYESSNVGDTWSSSTSLYSNQAQPGIVGVAKYATSKTVAIYASYADGEFKYKTHSGTSWSSGQPQSTSGAGLTANALKTNAFSITSDGTCAWIGYVQSNAGGVLKSMKFCDGAITFPATSITGINTQPTISAIGSDIHLSYVRNNIINKIKNTSGTWGTETQPFGTAFNSVCCLHAAKTATSSAPMVFREGASSPFILRFGMIS